MNQQELEDLLRQIAPNGNPGRLAFSEATETVETEVPDPDDLTGKTTVKRKVPVRVLQWTDPGTGQTLKVQADPATGTYTKTFQGVDPKQQGAPATTPAQQQADETGTPTGTREETDANGRTTKVTTYRRPDGTTYERTDVVQAAPAKPQVAPATLNTTSPNMATVMPDGSLKWAPNPNYQKPNPVPIPLPPTTKWTIWQDPDGTTRTEKNPNYVPPSKVEYDQQTGRWIQVTEDDDGKPVIREVTPQTTIRPADIPVLQTKYGQVASSLGQLAQDLNGKAARGVITPQERDAAFKAAHEQATVAVDEMNTILGNSKAVWENEIQQRGQTFSEAANRRSYAGSIMNNAVSTGQHIAESAGPGHGRATALGVMTLMDMGQKYAQGMGGFPSMDPVAAPRALQQAASVGLPGFGDNTPPPAAPPPGGQAAPSNPFDQAARGITGATHGLIDSALHPASVTSDAGAAQRPVWGPPPPIPGQSPAASDDVGAREYQRSPTPLGLAPPGGTPPMQTLPQQGSPPPLSLLGQGMGMGASGSPIGVPASIGGGGAFDHRREGEAMLGASMTGGYGGAGVADPAWEEAVRRAMAMYG